MTDSKALSDAEYQRKVQELQNEINTLTSAAYEAGMVEDSVIREEEDAEHLAQLQLLQQNHCLEEELRRLIESKDSEK